MKLEYNSLKEARENFSWSERWEVFDKDRDSLNIAYECVDRHPKEKIAIRMRKEDGSHESYTFGELSQYSSQFANMLARKGVGPGDRVGVILNPSLEYYVSLYGIVKAGAVAVPCYSLLGPDGIEYRLKDSNAKMALISKERMHCVNPGLVSNVVASEELMDLIAKEDDTYATNTSFDTLALIQFSSGTTGQPTQVPYNHAAMSVTAVFIKFWIGLKAEDRYICTSSPAWGHGIWYGTVGPLVFGNGLCAYSGRFNAEDFLKTLEDFEINVISAIPRVYKILMESGKINEYDLKLRRLTYSGGRMDPEVQKYFNEKLGVYIGSTYGNTESGPVVLDFAFDDWKPKLGSAGKPMLGVKMGILDDEGNELGAGKPGEVAVWRKGTWSKIGDSGSFDEEGYFFPQGRSDDVIKSSGYRIGPFEIEAVLEKHPAIQKSAVVGTPDEQRGELVKAFIILNDGYTSSDDLIAEIQDYVKTRLSMHEYPKEIEFIDELPETPDGKLKRKVLKKQEYEKKGKRLS